MTVIIQVGIMSLLIGVGFLCGKVKIITAESSKCLSDLALKVATPALLIASFQKDLSPEKLAGLGWACVLALAAFVVCIGAGYLTIRAGGDRDKQAIERFSAIYSNCAFMGIPLINGIYGEEGVFYLTAFYALFNILVWSHGAIMMNGGGGLKSLLHALKAPALISVFVGVILFLCQIRLPDFILQTLTYAGNLNTPLGMLVAGATIAWTDLVKALKKGKIYYISLIRLLVIPVIVIFLVQLFPCDPIIKGVTVASAACPTATICTMFAVSFKKDSLYASEIFAVCTVLSMATLPVVMWLFELISQALGA